MARRGPKANHYVSTSGETILGLRKDRKSGRFYPVGKGSPNFGRDERKAIHRFRLWQHEQQNESDPLETRSSVDDLIINEVDAESLAVLNPKLLLDSPLVRGIFRDYYRDLIYANPRQAATELDCEPVALLAHAEELEPRAPTPLGTLCDTYLNDKTLSSDEAKNSRTWWNEFQEVTQGKVVTDLNREAFKLYRKTIKARKGKRSNIWVRSRFGKIKTIVNHATLEMDLSSKEKRVLADVALLKLPPKPTPKPVDISRKEMKAILSKADKWDKALILLALNAAYTPIDCQRLAWDMINWRNGTIRFDRSKPEHLTAQALPRICSLWRRTTRALKAIKNGHKNVFVSTQGQPAHIDTINDHFVTCCEEAGVKGLTFKHLRKSALTAASNDPSVPDRQINLLAGHSAGIKEHYVVRRNVQLACEAVERYYFG